MQDFTEVTAIQLSRRQNACSLLCMDPKQLQNKSFCQPVRQTDFRMFSRSLISTIRNAIWTEISGCWLKSVWMIPKRFGRFGCDWRLLMRSCCFLELLDTPLDTLNHVKHSLESNLWDFSTSAWPSTTVRVFLAEIVSAPLARKSVPYHAPGKKVVKTSG